MNPVFGPRSNVWTRVIAIGMLLGLAVAIVAAFPGAQTSTWATRIGEAPTQPVPFSHAHHVAGLGLDCTYCHTSFDSSSFAGMPPADTCMNCHSQLYTTAPMLEPVRESWRTGTPIRWQRVNSVPDFVFFNHSVHVAANISCTACHGEVETMPLTWQAAPLRMRWCLECHRSPHAGKTSDGLVPTLQGLEGDEIDLGSIDANLLTSCSACHR